MTLSSNLSLSSLLVRETVQNSWDARDDELRGNTPVVWSAEGRTMAGGEVDALRRFLPLQDIQGFTREASQGGVGLIHPHEILDGQRSVETLIVSDRWTVGLSGPSRGGVAWESPVRNGRPWPEGARRFAYFIRNTGRPRSDVGAGDGGSYGIGKSVLWRASRCGTVLVHTRTTDENGHPVDRLVGAVHGADFISDGKEYTGRHFSGVPATESEDLVEPLTGAAAMRAVEALDLPRYPEGSFGTTVVILAPRFAGGGEEAMTRIRDAVRWQVWPKFAEDIRSLGAPADMSVRVSWQGSELPIPNPDDDSELASYVEALRHAVSGRRMDSSDELVLDHLVKCGNPIKELGWLRLRPSQGENAFHVSKSIVIHEDSDEPGNDVGSPVPFENGPHGHVALIRRNPLLLVKYLDLPEEVVGERDALSGVFLSADDDDVERALTAAEPPAHDDWRFEQVRTETGGRHGRTFAKMTVQRVNAAIRSLRTRRSGGVEPGDTGAVSSAISRGLMGSGWGGGRSKKSYKNGSGTGGGGPTVALDLRGSKTTAEGTRHHLGVSVSNAAGPVSLIATAGGRDSAGAMPVADAVAFRWVGPMGSVDGPRLELKNPEVDLDLHITVTSALRIVPRVKIGDASDA